MYNKKTAFNDSIIKKFSNLQDLSRFNGALEYYLNNQEYIDNFPEITNIFELLDYVKNEKARGYFKYQNNPQKNLHNSTILRILFLAGKIKKLQSFTRWGGALDYYEKNKEYIDSLPSEFKDYKELNQFIKDEQAKGNFKYSKKDAKYLHITSVINILFISGKIIKENSLSYWGSAGDRYEREKFYFDQLPFFNDKKIFIDFLFQEWAKGNLKNINDGSNLSVVYIAKILHCAKKISPELLDKSGQVNYFIKNIELFKSEYFKALQYLRFKEPEIFKFSAKYQKNRIKEQINKKIFLKLDSTEIISEEYFRKMISLAYDYWQEQI